MLLEKVREYYSDKYDLNCSETIIYAANEEYNLNLSKETLKTMAAFGGGMGIESTCGAATGALAVLGIIFTQERAHESTRVKDLAREFMKNFIKRLNTNNCKELKERYRNDEVRCSKMVDAAAVILDDIVLREMKR
jgi:C_GCAxxG_C_C family probable redox protein